MKLYIQSILFFIGVGTTFYGVASQQIEGLPAFVEYVGNCQAIDAVHAQAISRLNSIPYTLEKLVKHNGKFYIEIAISREHWDCQVEKCKKDNSDEARLSRKRWDVANKSILALLTIGMGCFVVKKFKTIKALIALPIIALCAFDEDDWDDIRLFNEAEIADEAVAARVANNCQKCIDGFELIKIDTNTVILRSTFAL